jgi:hypothetical protein
MGFLSGLLGFENSFSKNFTKDIFHNPTRLLTGIDPASTKAWNTVLGRDDKPLVNVYGSPGDQYYDQAAADGVDTGPGRTFHGIADKVAGYYGMQGLGNVTGGMTTGGSSGGGNFMGGNGLGSLLGGVLGAVDSNKQPDSQTNSQKLDPRFDAMMFGQNGQDGLLGQYAGYLGQPQNPSLQRAADTSGNYLDWFTGADLGNMRNAATKMLGGNQAPGAGQLAWAQGNMVQAPAQNGLNLTGSYDSLINGQAGANPYLTGAIQKGINQSTNAFQGMQQDATKNLMENVMPGIRSNSVLAGQYGGSRQGIAEGRAMGDFGTAMARATGQFGQNNTDAAVSAQAGAYDADRNRQLAATQGLGAQQYATAFKDADTKNAAEFMNVGNVANWNRDNMNSQLQTNGQNNAAVLGGSGLLSGLLGSTANNVNTNQNYGLNRATQVNGLLTPWAAMTNSTSQPLYNNKMGNIMGGAMMGSQLAGLFGNSGSGGSNAGSLMDLFGSGSSFSGGGYF